ncbi:putative ABC transporter [Nostocoides japonicum T1-X7]|uniref:Putative ABC transporter n=1 Tax=Nostocoides japonicum T1-X7 TaxID=1194083 RepID=A0A077LZ12_9MICO|nr:hypothetical protein [Tetrasphaera japonica]CCH77235.1 putative ABC transporter [Tetrasphaera japonica T1-X7]
MTELAGTGSLLRLAWRRDRWILVVVALVLAVIPYSTMASTLDLYTTDAAAQAGARVMEDTPSVLALYGPLPSLTAEGVGIIKAILMGGLGTAFLAFAVVRRHTRTEEEEGRLELVAAGVVGRRAPMVAAVVLAVLAVAATAVLSALLLLPTGAGAAGAVAFAATILTPGLAMAGVTAVACQLTATTRGAGAIALGVLGAAYVLRVVGDTASDAGWLTWLSFLGWAEKVAPYGANRPSLLLLAVALLLVLLLVADVLLHRRDLGAGLWATRPGPAHASSSLAGASGLAWRLQRGSVIGWTIGYAVLGIVVGSLASSAGDIASDPSVRDMLAKMSGGHGTVTDLFLGTELRFMAIGAAAFAVVTALRLRSEETAGHAEVVLATPVSRWRWLAGHVSIALLGAAWLMLVAGLAAGLVASASSGYPVASLVGAALATVPAAWVMAGLTLLLFGLVPRLSALAWGVLAVFLLLGEFGELLKLPDWVIGLAPFDHLGSLPGGTVSATALLGLVVIAAVCLGLGGAGFRHRDLTT